MLAVSFPPMADASTAWAALVPLLMVCRLTRPGPAFRWGFLSGVVFWLATLYWLLCLGKTGGPWPLVVLGWLLLSGYCAVFMGGFALLVAGLFQRFDRHIERKKAEGKDEVRPAALARVGMVFAIPVLWVGFEYLRGVLFTGFPWNALGVSQYDRTVVIQVAEWGGVYAVSAVVASMNAAIAMMLVRFVDSYRVGQQGRLQFDLMAGLLICALCWFFGMQRINNLAREKHEYTEVRIGAVQPNVEQLKKWTEAFDDYVYGAVRSNTTTMVEYGEPDLAIWPETAVPGQLSMDPGYCTPVAREFVNEMAELGAPLLVGVIEMGPGPVIPTAPRLLDDARPDVKAMMMAGELVVYNSSFLCTTNGIVAGYRKQHLVPFGEYLPFDKTLTFLQHMAPVGYSCTPGNSGTVFRLSMGDGKHAAFSTLICFEDIVAPLSRDAVRRGARMLVNQTNDAWFDGSAGAVQHMTHCVFRCVENRVPAVRCANTGVTCFIDKFGKIDKATRDRLKLSKTRPLRWKYRMDALYVEGPEMRLTFYTRYGDLPFAIPCAAASVIGLVGLGLRRYRQKKLASGGRRTDTVPRAGESSGSEGKYDRRT